MGNYLVACMFSSEEPYYRRYVPETGNYIAGASSLIPQSVSLWMDEAVSALKEGSSVGMMVLFTSRDYTVESGGHAVTVYGFTYDESKAGTPHYYTGVIVADPDDDKGSPKALNGVPASQSPDRMKILDIEYDEANNK